MQSKQLKGRRSSRADAFINQFVIAKRHIATSLAILALMPQFAIAAEAGSTAGSFTVTPSGAANYTIPIPVPPGTAGMQPGLALVYNSQSGDGLMGMRWKLAGLSSVTRCSNTLVQDNAKQGISHTNADKYCLDGQRLIPVDTSTTNSGCATGTGVEYRTERESFARIVACGSILEGASGINTGPSYFKAWTKSGQIIEFGNTADSKIEAQGKSAVQLWAISKVTDTKGNFLTASYTKDSEIDPATNLPKYTGQYYPVRIDYSGNAKRGLAPYNSVRFSYIARSDVNPVYEAGSIIKGTKILSAIRTYARGYTAAIKEYRLAYQSSFMTQRSRLDSLTECDGTGDLAKCLSPTSFIWTLNSGYAPLGHPGFYYSSTWQGYGILASLGRWVDMNGDGMADYITSDLNGTSYISFADIPGIESRGNYSKLSWVEPFASPRGATWLDMNGDGKTDMVTVDVNGVISIANSTGTAYATPISVNTGTVAGVAKWTQGYYPRGIQYTCTSGGEILGRVIRDDYPARCEGDLPTGIVGGGTGANSPIWGGCYCPDSHYFADLNGDGKMDYIAPEGAVHHVSLSTDDPSVYINQTWTAQAKSISGHHWVDLNGDGKADYVTNDVAGTHYVSFSTGSGYVNQVWYGHGISTSGAHWVDLNGDGKSDYVTNDAAGNHFVSLSTGTGYASQTWHGHGISTSGAHWADINGDGRSDYLTEDTAGNHYVSMSTGTGYVNQTWTGSGLLATGGNWVDLNGDGRADYVTSDAAGNHSVSLSARSSDMADGLTQITNGLGASTYMSYSPLTHDWNYQVDTTSAYPVLDLRAPIYAVGTVMNSNGIGGTHYSTYSYAGAKVHAKGGGFLGFREVSSTDNQTGIKSTTTYRQDYPHQGLIEKVEKRSLNGGLLNQAVNTWDFVANSQWSVQYHVPNLIKSVETSYESVSSGTGALVSTLTTDTEYDSFGNATKVTTATTDGHRKVTDNIYTNDTTKWFLGRLTSATVTSTAPGTVPVITPTPAVTSFSIAALSADKPEGNSGTTPFTFTVARTGNAGSAASVNWTVTGSGAHSANQDDFIGNVFPSGTLSFAVGQTSQTLTIEVVGNNLKGSDDGFTVTLSNSTNASIGTASAVGVIRNDDTILPPVISIAALASDKLEGDSGTTPYTFTLSRSGQDVTGPSTVRWAVTGSGTAPANGADFAGGALPIGTLSFAAGQTNLILTVNVQSDGVVEPDESFAVTLSNATDATVGTATANGSIRNEASDAYFYTPQMASIADYNLRAEAIADGWNQTAPLNAIVTLNSGVVISSSSTSTPAFIINGSYPGGSSIDLVINSGAYIVGKGGAGGTPGLPGGPAMSIAASAANVRITNNGVIGGGGGGGGNSGHGWIMSCDNGNQTAGANYPGGGGAGYGSGPGAIGGLTTGGAGVGSIGRDRSGAGGNLGGIGDPGYGFDSNCGLGQAYLGGAGGAAVLGDENVTWLAVGTLLGATNSARVVSSIQPNTGHTWGGESITLNGSGFVPGMTVTLGGRAATGCIVNAARTAVTCATPTHSAGVKDVVISSGGIPVTLTGGFTYQAFALSGVAPTGGIETGGTSITLSGSGFAAGAAVTIGGVAATGCTVASSNSMSCSTPAGSIGAKDVVVSLAGHSTTLTGGFTYTIAPFSFNSVLVSTQDYNLRAAAVAAGWDQVKPLIATVTINSGVVISSSSTVSPAFTISGPYPAGSIINLDIKAGAYIVGKGGAGANPNGQPGGPAMSIASSAATIRITNNGVIGGGGGAGGYGGGGWIMSCDNGRGRTGTGYGGGGAGYGLGPGAVGGLTTGGAGASLNGAVSGTGGTLGAAGGNGHAANCVDGSIHYGGTGGAATIGAANAIWLVTGTRLGALQ